MERKVCGCGMNMILEDTGEMLLTYPPQMRQVWRCFSCGAQEPGPTIVAGDDRRKRWEAAQFRHVWVGEYRTSAQTLYWTGDWVTSGNGLEFVLTDDIYRARHFATKEEATAVLSAAGFWPRYDKEYRLEVHQIGGEVER